jgi:hypothetical protein
MANDKLNDLLRKLNETSFEKEGEIEPISDESAEEIAGGSASVNYSCSPVQSCGANISCSPNC